jgi:hypothetical protein
MLARTDYSEMLIPGFQTIDPMKIISLPSISSEFYRDHPRAINMHEAESSQVLADSFAWWSVQLVDLILHDRVSVLLLEQDLGLAQSNPDLFEFTHGMKQANMYPQTARNLLPVAEAAVESRSNGVRGALRDFTPLPADLWGLVVGFAVERHWPNYFISVAKPLDNDDDGLDQDEVATVQSQTDCVPQAARRALRKTGNIIDAILALTP